MARAAAKQTEPDTTAGDPSDFVLITHEKDGDGVVPGRVTRRAFDRKWSDKGFKIVDAPAASTGTEADGNDSE